VDGPLPGAMVIFSPGLASSGYGGTGLGLAISHSYFPQGAGWAAVRNVREEARGFVQLNSFSHPTPSHKHAPRPVARMRIQLGFVSGGCGKESYELGCAKALHL
jgi:hypothetical protein